MPMAQLSTALLTLTTNNNVLSGNLIEFVPMDSLVEFFMTQSATGLVVNITSGTDTVGLALAPNIRAAVDTSADKIGEDVAMKGDHLIISATNPTAGTLTLFTLVRITAL